MKKKQGVFFGFAIMLIMAIITMAGCEMEVKDEFPSGFIGTWKRTYQSVYTNTLHFTSKTIKDSTQNFYWDLQSVSGNAYTLKSTTGNTTYTITIKLENGYLNFGIDNTSGEHDWQGVWGK
jgi:hypothetical protein